jgi:hypothetical protein
MRALRLPAVSGGLAVVVLANPRRNCGREKMQNPNSEVAQSQVASAFLQHFVQRNFNIGSGN